jgi:hypothetical protein
MALVDDLRDIVNLAHATAWQAANLVGKTSPDEPGIVSQLVRLQTKNAIQTAVANWPAGQQYATLSGSFIHQSPKVTFSFNGNLRTTEIGDLLLLGIDHNNHCGRGTLLQVKKSSQRTTGSLAAGNADAQLHLYQQWPAFVSANGTFPINSTLTASPWNLGIHPDTGNYMTVYDKHAYQVPPAPLPGIWKPMQGPQFVNFKGSFDTAIPPDEASMTFGDAMAPGVNTNAGVNCPKLLGDLMDGLLLQQQGRPFHLLSAPNASFDDWDYFIHEMLNLGAKASYTFNHAASGAINVPRHALLSFCSAFPAQALALTTLMSTPSARALKNMARIIGDGQKGPFFPPFYWGELRYLLRYLEYDLSGNWPDAAPDFPGIQPPGIDSKDQPDRGFGVLVFHLFGTDGRSVPV